MTGTKHVDEGNQLVRAHVGRTAHRKHPPMKSLHRTILAISALALGSSCSNRTDEAVPPGYAVIREHVVSAPRNDPPISSTLDFTLIEVDGKPVIRETIPRWVDMQPGALVSAGNHEFKARVSPHARPPNHQPTDVVFKLKVESQKVYYLVDKDGWPVLVEGNHQPPW